MTNLFNTDIIAKYNTSGPRYTSYPTALEFTDQLPDRPLHHAALTSAGEGLSLYVHIPFCHSLCYYCGCHKIVTRQHDKADRYIDYLAQEMALNHTSFRSQPVRQCHLGGGTPSFLSPEQMTRLMNHLRHYYVFAEDCEISIELDPRQLDTAYVDMLWGLGFNRLSIGVQDVNDVVQSAINRVQATEDIAALVTHAKHIGFSSVNLDLIYGLPHQTTDTFAKTLRVVGDIDPERISLFSYAHMPTRFAAQRKIKEAWLPSPEAKFRLMLQAIETLSEQGYDLIGMDHFAKPHDELAIAQRSGTLHRNFQGYTTRANLNMLGIGISSISFVGDWYMQNAKTLNEYYAALDQRTLPTQRGVVIQFDDAVRRSVIMSLMCNLSVDKIAIERDFEIQFDDYFKAEMDSLYRFECDGLLRITASSIDVKPHARLLIRNIAMTFDAYLGLAKNHQRFSRVI
ncbi:oxygen-independent coproporphyrinogen III oxidase [Alteromonas oceanisediminis]|uniref:oxygen-independent coproporphyrinogen III oxidase n=1 Tax=Alteromonas oceanisediminis TaxID=2836180 RepID=UPI001BDA046C|nr:oxygen-independent coproporphyrinogen III oxidase [Alteromonas oceanisediminis]MBT0587331.1 oxygen-independent coproporphyrinogen III oxidase [Alteromonas oceanisediminis]